MKKRFFTQSRAEQRAQRGKLCRRFIGSKFMELSLHTASTSASVHGTCFCLSSLPHTLLVALSNSPVPPLVGRSWLEVNLTRPQVPCLIPTSTPFPSDTWALDSHCYSIFMCGQTGPDRYVENQTLGAGWGGHTLVHTSLSWARLAPSDPFSLVSYSWFSSQLRVHI